MGSISAKIHTYNEADYIEECIESCIPWADEIVIIDMESTDNTVELAGKYTDKIFTHPWLPTADPARNFGLQKVTGEWVMELDPDERVTEKLGRTFRRIADDPNSANAYYVPYLTVMFGRPIRHSGWGNDEHMHFFRREKCTWLPYVHLKPQIEGPVGRISRKDGCVVHLNYRDISHFIEKLNRYTTMEAERLHDENRPFHWLKLFYQPTKEFFRRYLVLKGYKDGVVGLFLAAMMAFYTQASYIKLWEMYDRDKREKGSKDSKAETAR